MVVRALLSMVFHDQGAHTMSTLCNPAAAILKALFANNFPLIYLKSLASESAFSRGMKNFWHYEGRKADFL